MKIVMKTTFNEENIVIKRIVISAVLALLLIAALVSPAVGQSGTEVGVASNGLNSLELIGRIDQQLFNSITYGYVTHVSGLAPELLFSAETDPLLRGEATARITFYGTGNSTTRSVYENIFASSVPLELTFYYSEAPVAASFDNPESFQAGTPIAVQTIRMQTLLNVQEPNVGVLMGDGEGIQSQTVAFTLSGTSYSLGHNGMVQEFNLFGQGFRASENPLAANYIYGGNATVVGE
jgi:hypothetical protein